MTCNGSIDVHGYRPEPCTEAAADFCKTCQEAFCSAHLDVLGYCAGCLASERYRAAHPGADGDPTITPSVAGTMIGHFPRGRWHER